MIKRLLFLMLLSGIGVAAAAMVNDAVLHLPGYEVTSWGYVSPYTVMRGYSIADTTYFFGDHGAITVTPIVAPDDSMITFVVKVGDTEIDYPVFISFDRYFDNSVKSYFRQLFYSSIRQSRQQAQQNSGAGGMIPEYVFKMPPGLPRWLAPTNNVAARLNIDGSQKLTISGESTSRKNAASSESSSNKDFKLKMLQELRLKLKGTIGEKIFITLNHTSVTDEQVSNPNVLDIQYKGEEDEIMQSIEGGNIALALSGSQFISYSVNSDGLFGVKANSKIGPLTLTTIIGKEEGEKSRQKYTGQSQADSLEIASKSYVNRTRYFLADPSLLYELYTKSEAAQEGKPSTWANNAVMTDSDGKWIIKNSGLLPKEQTTVRVFLDDQSYGNDEIATIEGHSLDSSDETVYNFEELLQDSDYSVDYDTGVITMNRTINRLYAIGVIYTNRAGTTIGSYSATNLRVMMIRRPNQDSTYPTWKYELRNIYSLGHTSIQNDDFKFTVYYQNESGTKVYDVPTDIETTWQGTFDEYLRLDVNGDGLVNGDDATINLSGGYVIFPFLRPFYSLGDSAIYDVDPDQITDTDDYNMFMHWYGKVGRDQISLGSTNILKGSVKITVNNTTLQENVDYTVDYDTGIITMMTSAGKDPTAQIVIDYEYVPLFSLQSRTLFGFRGDLNISENARLGTTFIYQSEKVADKHPKIGNENKIQMMADIDGQFTVHPEFMTRMVDALPLVRTDEQSIFALTGEVAMNIPKIYGDPSKKDDPEAYLDDMESIIDTYPFGVLRGTWEPGGRPLNILYSEASINWYNPDNIYMKDVYNNKDLSDDDKNEKASVLRCKLAPLPATIPGGAVKYEAGLMKYIGNQVDFSEKKYIEIMLKCDSLVTPVNVHIDMGDISEDFYTRFGNAGVLNTEDGKNGGQKDGLFDYMEDVGLDGIKNGNSGDDPDDDYDNDKNSKGDYPHINGTENNNQLDTEDLNGNGALDTTNRYFEYSLNIGQSAYLAGRTEKGYLLYRIPIDDEDARMIVSDTGTQPNLSKVSYVRVWFDTEKEVHVNLVKLDVIGNKWEEAPIRTASDNTIVSQTLLTSNNETMKVGTIDNQNDDHYAPPKGTFSTSDGVQSLEQSLSIAYTNLQPGHVGVARQKFSTTYNLLNYHKIRLWLYPESDQEETYPDSLLLIVRLGADSLNYYEVGIRVKSNDWNSSGDRMSQSLWKDYEINFDDLTELKNLVTLSTDNADYTSGNFYFHKQRNPTLTNIKEMALGLEVPSSSQAFSGKIYYDDIRVADPDNSIGYAASSSLHTKFADLDDLTINLTWKTPNFYTINTGDRSSGTVVPQNFQHSLSVSASNSFHLDKFLPLSWGIVIPVTTSQSQSVIKPLYKSNSDILVSNLDEDEKDRQTTRTLNRSISSSLSETRSLGSPILDYTLKNINLSGDLSRNVSLSPTARDTTITYNEQIIYNVDLPKDRMSFGLWKNYLFYWFPKTFTNTIKFTAKHPRHWNWNETTQQYTVGTQIVAERWLNQSHNVTYDVFSDLTATGSLDLKRNMLWPSEQFGVNLGRSKTYSQKLSLDYKPQYTERFFSLSASLDANYNDEQKATKMTHEITGEKYLVFSVTGGSDRTSGLNLTLKNSDWLSSLADYMGATGKKSQKAPKPLPDSKPNPRQDAKPAPKPQPTSLPDTDKPQGSSIPSDGKKFTENGPDESNPDNLPPIQLNDNGELPPDASPNPKEESPADTTFVEPQISLPARLVALLSRIDNITTTYTNKYSSVYESRNNRPAFNYMLGLPHVLKADTLTQVSNADSYSANTSLPILDNLMTQWKYSLNISRVTSTSTVALERKTVFPDVDFTLSGFDKYILRLLGKNEDNSVMQSSMLSSSLTITKDLVARTTWGNKQTSVDGLSLTPLLDWKTTWTFHIDTDFSYGYSKSVSTTYVSEGGNRVGTTTRQQFSSQFVHHLNAARGLKIPFFGVMRLKNEFTTTLNLSYDKNYTDTKNEATKLTQVSTNTVKTAADISGSYNFHRNVQGQMTIDWSRTSDLKRNEVTTTFGLSVSVTIQF